MFDFTNSEFSEWKADLTEGEIELIDTRHQLGELSVTFFVHHKERAERSAFEMKVRPDWFCVFDDERQQTALIRSAEASNVAVRMFEVLKSPLLASLRQAEPLFETGAPKARHWVMLGLDACCHIIAQQIPTFRKIF